MAPIDNKNNQGDKKYKITTAAETAAMIQGDIIGTIYDKLEPENIPGYLVDGVKDFLTGKAPKASDVPYSNVYIENKVAKEFGDSKDFSEWVKSLDKELQVQSFYAIKSIKERAKEGLGLDWDSVVAAMHNADGLTMVPDSHKKVYDCWNAESTSWFKFDGSSDKAKINQIQAWFKKSICDVDAVVYDNSTLVNEGVVTHLAKIAAETGAKVDSFKHFWSNSDSRSDKVLEIGLIRFPSKEDPHVKLYRIQIFAWFNCARVLMVQHDQAGFDLEFDVMKFKPVDAVVNAITEEQLKKVTAKLDDPNTFDF